MYDSKDDYHTCHFCGEYVRDGLTFKGERHWLSDCRPDLVEHEIGEICTWSYRRKDLIKAVSGEIIPALPENHTCYAYEDYDSNYKRVWTNEHIHFYPDGSM